jgi:hypothetical protein
MGANTTSDNLPRARILNGDMTSADIVEVLERLEFRNERTGRDDAMCLLRLDSPVRDYLVAALRRKI